MLPLRRGSGVRSEWRPLSIHRSTIRIRLPRAASPPSTSVPDAVPGTPRKLPETPTTCAEKSCASVRSRMAPTRFHPETCLRPESRRPGRKSTRWDAGIRSASRSILSPDISTGATSGRTRVPIPRAAGRRATTNSTRPAPPGTTVGRISSRTIFPTATTTSRPAFAAPHSIRRRLSTTHRTTPG